VLILHGIRAPQAMAVDVFLQVVESTSSRDVAEHIVALLSILFPSRPLYGTSHAMAIFSTFRQRFCELGPEFQSLAVEFTRKVLLIEPTEWFAHEFSQLGLLITECDAHGATQIASCFRALATERVYLDSMKSPAVLRNLVDVISKFTSPRPDAEAIEADQQVHLVDDLLTVLEAVSTASDDARDCVYYYGMATFLAALHCRPSIRERVAL
jgi:hypothetical protein